SFKRRCYATKTLRGVKQISQVSAASVPRPSSSRSTIRHHGEPLSMDLSYSNEYLAFRDEVRQFLADNWDPKQARDPEQGKAYTAEFRRKATLRGYLNRSIPKRYGGSEQPADVLRGHIIKEEFG